MENYSYATLYPESGDLSPRSRETDFENTQPWEEQPPAPASNNYKVKFMCSYGGKIHPRPNDNQLSYVGGETKILVVDRNIKFSGVIGKLSAFCEADVCFKYQLPGEDLDALISVTNDDDLEHMMHEYDRLCRASSKPARLRLFLFTLSQPELAPSGSFDSGEARNDRERFVDALNSGPIQSSPQPLTVAPPNNVDFLFGMDKGMAPPLQEVTKVPDPISEPEIADPALEDRVIGEDQMQRQIQDLQRFQIGGREQVMYKTKSDDNLVGGFTGDYYTQKFSEQVSPASPAGYWPDNHIAGGFYAATPPGPNQSVYMIPAPTGMYNAPMGRSVTGPTGQGYYAVQRMPPEVYRDQPPMYNVGQTVAAPAATAMAPPTLPPQPPPKGAGYSEGFGMPWPTTAGGVGVVDTGYMAVAYDSGVGRQVYYNPQGGVVPPPYQAMAAPVSADMRPGGALNQEGKVVL